MKYPQNEAVLPWRILKYTYTHLYTKTLTKKPNQTNKNNTHKHTHVHNPYKHTHQKNPHQKTQTKTPQQNPHYKLKTNKITTDKQTKQNKQQELNTTYQYDVRGLSFQIARLAGCRFRAIATSTSATGCRTQPRRRRVNNTTTVLSRQQRRRKNRSWLLQSGNAKHHLYSNVST